MAAPPPLPLASYVPLLFYLMFNICSPATSLSSASKFDVSAKCPHILTPSTLLPRDNSTGLRVLVPWKVGFEQFASFSPDSCRFDGLSVQVFQQALSYMHNPPPPQYQYVVFGAGDETPKYDDMIDMLVRGEVDIVVADLTITRERMEKVAFTVPYLPSSLAMVTPFSYGSRGTLWDFLKPFSPNLWIVLLVCFGATGVALYLLEDQNPEFSITTKKGEGERQGSSHGGSYKKQLTRTSSAPSISMFANTSRLSCPPSSPCNPHPHPTSIMVPNHGTPPPLPLQNISNGLINGDMSSLQRPGPPIYDQASHKRRVMNAYWFTSLCIFQSQPQKRYPTIAGFQALRRDVSISVGYKVSSFMGTYMKKIHMDEHELKSFTSEGQYVQALRKGNFDPHGVGAILDELPYIQILLQADCSLTQSSANDDNLPSFGGFGFAFRKEDPLLEQMSKMILTMAEDGMLRSLQDWKIGDVNTGKCDSNEGPSHLRLRSFGGLITIIALIYTFCIMWNLFWKIIKSRQGRCITLTNQALPCSSTIGQACKLSLCKRNRVMDESNIDHISP